MIRSARDVRGPAPDWAFDYRTTPDVIERRLFQLDGEGGLASLSWPTPDCRRQAINDSETASLWSLFALNAIAGSLRRGSSGRCGG